MSIKICVFLILGLLIIIHESESIKCYDCFHWIHGDGENCHKGFNLREKDCPNSFVIKSLEKVWEDCDLYKY